MQTGPNTLRSYFQEHFSHSEDTAFVDRHGLRTSRWSYRQIGELAESWAACLAERNVAKGDRVLLWAENSAHWVAAFYGCVLRGAIVVPLDPASAPDFAARVHQQVGAKVLLADKVPECQRALDGLPALALHHQPTARPVPAEPVEPDDLVEIIFTSGTTAEPRGICLTHRNLLANLRPIEKEVHQYSIWNRWFHPVRFLNLVPLSHVFGQFMAILLPPLLQSEVHFQNTLNPGELIDRVKAERISVVVAVPRFLESLKEKLERDSCVRGIVTKADVSMLRRVWRARQVHRRFGWKFWAFVSGGATLPPATERFWRTLGFAVVQGYGMTETAALVSVAHPFRPKTGSIGKRLPGMEMKVAANGEILVRGDNISPGFWNGGIKPLTDAEGWLHTGDLARPTDDGHLYFQGRQKDVIVTAAGMNIHPEDLEASLNRQEGIRSSAVVDIEGRQGPEPVAILLLRDPSQDPTAAVAEANQELAPYQQVRRWLIWPEADFPRTPTQKVRKPALVAWIQSQEKDSDASRATSRTSSTSLGALIGRVCSNVPANLDRSSRLDSDLKLDSLGRVELLSLLEEQYQIDLDEHRLNSATTIGELEDQLKDRWGQLRPDEMNDASSRAKETIDKPALRGAESGRRSFAQTTGTLPFPYPRWPLCEAARWTRAAMLKCLILPVARLLSRLEVSGLEDLDSLEEPSLLVANHVTNWDPGVILTALPGRFRNRIAIAMDGERLRSWRYPAPEEGIVRRIGRRCLYCLVVLTLNVFPLPRSSGFRRSFAFAGTAMDRGFHVLVFPEGRLTEDGNLLPFRKGIGLLAAGLNAPVVPVKLEGLFELRRRPNRGLWTFLLHPGKVSVRLGAPLRFESGQDAGTIVMELEQAVADLGKSIPFGSD
ncbi:MAG: AMP-binding protein [Acidimicrobiia bacterium]|nr:AMP-binding protein [Acidimicrobiia bacterium]